MKISALIKQLRGDKQAYGDLEVTCKETLTPTTRDKKAILDGEAFETTVGQAFYTEYTEAFQQPHIRITL